MSELFNNILNNLDNGIHDKIKNTSLDNFIHELKESISKSNVTDKLSNMPQDTLFEINEVEENYIECYYNHEKFDIPKDMVDMSDFDDFDINFDRLQLQDDGLYHIVKI